MKDDKRLRYWPCFLLITFILLLGGAVSVSAEAKLSKREVTLTVGKKVTLQVTGGVAESWKSSNKKVATVSSKGVVKGRGKGTAEITCTTGGTSLVCYVVVRPKQLSKYVTNAQAKVWMNMLGAVESGGQVYGNRDYKLLIGPTMGGEVAITAGAYQEYGENLRQLLIRIRKEYPYTFKKYDKANIAADLNHSWDYYVVSTNSKKAKSIQNIIGCSAGKKVQDVRAVELLDEYLTHIVGLGVTNLRAAMFMAECEHLGGPSPVERVIRRASKLSIKALKTSLYQDQNDPSSGYQIGDKVYQTRHDLMYKWIVNYIKSSAKISA